MIKNVFLSLFILFLFGCRSTNTKPLDSSDLASSSWIGDGKMLPVNDSLLYNEDPAPLFRKDFVVKETIKSAKLFITAAGYYVATLNGEKIGKSYLEPAWTNYSKRVYYSEYDVTKELLNGENCLGVTLGNGWYNPLPLKMWGVYNLRKSLPVGRPQFIASLKLTYADGKVEELKTDKTWKYTEGPVLKNGVYLGEIHDARKDIPGWNKPRFDDKSWKQAVEKNGPEGKLQAVFSAPIIEYSEVKPISISSTKEGSYIVDMGFIFSGTFNIKLEGNPADVITIRTGERIYENGELNPMTVVCGQIKEKGGGGPGAPDLANPIDTYIFGDQHEVWYKPELTSHVFRYMEIKGLKKKPQLSDLSGVAFASGVQNGNSFSCSSDLLNTIQKISRQTFLNNLLSVQSDCAGRERFGYGGDLNATAETFISNFDMHSFYRKTVYDWVDAMNDSVFIDTAPFVGVRYCGISWESAFLTTQYNLFLYYNDTTLIHELYEKDLGWMEKVAKIHPNGIVLNGLADHESIIPSPIELIGTSHYLQCARIMRQFASVMNDKKSGEKFASLEQKITENLLNTFWKNSYAKPINKQTLFATLLYYNVLPECDRKAATDSLVKAVDQGIEGHFTTGIFGTQYVLEALSAAGHADKVFEVVNSAKYPGWGFMVDKGATTIWETWKESDDTFSNCHPMFGTVSGWFYRWLGGIRPMANYPGFQKFTISPAIPKGLTFAKCSYDSPLGTITSDWEKCKTGYLFKVTVPNEGIANFELPLKNAHKVLVMNTGNNVSTSPQVAADGSCKFELRGGKYLITADQ